MIAGNKADLELERIITEDQIEELEQKFNT